MGETAGRRDATIERSTNETSIRVRIDLDGTGRSTISTGVGFFDHMLDQLSRHSLIDMTIEAKGDLHIDDHHTVEDTGIALGQAIARALGDKRGILRYADCHLAMDECLTRVALDFSGRPFLVFRTQFHSGKIGTFDTQLVREFFQALAMHADLTLHVETLYGLNDHHMAESCFKGVARAMRQAGLRLDDLDFIELHDCFTIAELNLYEVLGLTGRGNGRQAVEDGWVHRGGRLPVNPSGGLKSKGHPVGATGVSQHVLAAMQLTGTAGSMQLANPSRAAVHNMGGLAVANYVTVLQTA